MVLRHYACVSHCHACATFVKAGGYVSSLVVMSRGHRAHGAEPREAKRSDSSLGPARYHHIRLRVSHHRNKSTNKVKVVETR